MIEVATVVNNSLTEQHPWNCCPKCRFRPGYLVFLLLVWSLPACDRDTYTYPSHPYDPATADLITKIRDKGWLDANCLRADMTAPDYPIYPDVMSLALSTIRKIITTVGWRHPHGTLNVRYMHYGGMNLSQCGQTRMLHPSNGQKRPNLSTDPG